MIIWNCSLYRSRDYYVQSSNIIWIWNMRYKILKKNFVRCWRWKPRVTKTCLCEHLTPKSLSLQRSLPSQAHLSAKNCYMFENTVKFADGQIRNEIPSVVSSRDTHIVKQKTGVQDFYSTKMKDCLFALGVFFSKLVSFTC